MWDLCHLVLVGILVVGELCHSINMLSTYYVQLCPDQIAL